MGGQAHNSTCTDAFTHSNQGVLPEVEMTAKHTMPHSNIHVSMSLCTGDGAEFRTQVGINTCTDAYTHSIQNERTDMRLMGQKPTATQGNPCFCVTMHRGLR